MSAPFGTAPALAGGPRRTFQPVRRNSYHRGEREHRIWQPLDPREKWARLRSAELFELENKEWGKRDGPLGHVALDVLRVMHRVIDYRTGRLEPSIDWLMRKLRRARATIVRALKRLKEAGFLEWIRRTEPTGNEGAGPQVRQITNAYGLKLPASAAAFVRKIMRRPPPPDDDAWRRQDAAEGAEAMLAALPLDELGRHFGGDSPLGESLAALGRALGRSANSLSGQNPDQEIKT
jgi:DNA-binding MarR family transcriptional regulator